MLAASPDAVSSTRTACKEQGIEQAVVKRLGDALVKRARALAGELGG
jgi:hypothetical protein